MAKRVKELVPNSLVTADVLENIETGRTRLKLSDALDIAIALGVPLVNLFVDVQKPFENNPLGSARVFAHFGLRPSPWR